MSTSPTDLAAIAAAGGTVLTALALFFTAYVTLRGQRDMRSKVTDIHHETSTSNGIPLGTLIERQEAYRILLIPEVSRTTSEQEYVDKLIVDGRNLGHTGPMDRTILPGEHIPTTQAERDIRPGVATAVVDAATPPADAPSSVPPAE